MYPQAGQIKTLLFTTMNSIGTGSKEAGILIMVAFLCWLHIHGNSYSIQIKCFECYCGWVLGNVLLFYVVMHHWESSSLLCVFYLRLYLVFLFVCFYYWYWLTEFFFKPFNIQIYIKPMHFYILHALSHKCFPHASQE